MKINLLKPNGDIREFSKRVGIPLWMIAERIGVSPSWFSVKLRKELSEAQRAEIFAAIRQLQVELKGA
ncbi:hypothetical protein ABE237_22480 [Brevibacillus formosus]|uniref:hypothetical protein n=1 Tax=Brevibacillus formosus TaxID=54913 RepID=UPI0018CDE761|nr:hypothetical protein [Brevibacillus formosus]MBG9941784.1 hypothetical protein [Brevibacillus formosus]